MAANSENILPVGFKVKSLPMVLRIPTSISRRLGITSPQLTPGNIFKKASKAAGLPAHFPEHIEEALEVLCRSYSDDANLHWFGRMNQMNLLVTGLSMFLKVEQAFRDRPELASTPLIPPLIVTGLPRSGTTFLHRLLSTAQDAHPVTLAEHMYPVWKGSDRMRSLKVEGLFQPWQWASKNYAMDSMHLVRPNLPDECNFGMRLSLRSMIFWATAPTYGYLRWLLSQDLRESYTFFRKVLLLHQAQHPNKRLTLKCPHHLAWLPALTEALPEALIIQTHRDPIQVVPSECKLILSLQALSTRDLNWRETVAHNTLKVSTFSERAVAFHDQDKAGRILHLDYKQVVSDPVGLTSFVREHFGLNSTPEQLAITKAFVENNRQHKYGRNVYSNAQFELNEKDLTDQFKNYRERFILNGVPAPRKAVEPNAGEGE